jgi:hypothetical protein
MSDSEPTSFVSHVFNFEQDSRNEMVNIIQYTILGVIFICNYINWVRYCVIVYI